MSYNRPLNKHEYECPNCGEIISLEIGVYDNKKERWCTTAEVRSLLRRGIVSAVVVSHKNTDPSWDFGTLYFEVDPHNTRYSTR